MTSTRFQMRGEIEAVDPMVVVLTAAAAEVIGPAAALRFELAASEALTNTVRHGLKGGAPEVAVDILLSASPRRVTLEIFDPEGATPFDPAEGFVLSDVADQTSESGRGLAILNQCADDMIYGLKNGRNRLSISFWAEGGK